MPDDEDEQFKRAMQGVRPLRSRAPPPAAARPRAVARFSRAERDHALLENSATPASGTVLVAGDEMTFHRPGVAEGVLRKLRRGQIPIEAEIDLHGLRRHAAHDALRAFLAECVLQRLTCVRVIHGKGLRSGPGGPILKQVVSHWLRQIENVVAFTSAQTAGGGTGAVYVLLTSPIAQIPAIDR